MRGTVLTLQMVEGKWELREAIHLTLFGGALRTTVEEDISSRFTQVKWLPTHYMVILFSRKVICIIVYSVPHSKQVCNENG